MSFRRMLLEESDREGEPYRLEPVRGRGPSFGDGLMDGLAGVFRLLPFLLAGLIVLMWLVC